MSDLEKVKAILLDAAEYPSEKHTQSSRAMLAEGLPHALLDSGMLAMQKDFANLISEALSDIKAAAETTSLTTADAVHEVEVKITSAQEAKEAAIRSKEKACYEEEAKTEAYHSAQAAHAAAEEFESGLLEQLKDIKDKKMEVDALLTSLQKFENSDGVEPLDFEGLLNYLTGAKVESTLLAAVPSAIQLAPSKRSSFDSLACEEVHKILDCEAAKLDAQLGPKEMEARYATAETLGLWAIHDMENEQMTEANITVLESKRNLLAAEEELTRQNAAMSSVSLWQASAKKKVQELDEANAAFTRLRCSPTDNAPAPALHKEVDAVDAVHLSPCPIATPMVV